jgi:large conductance mechanosensitive channel
MPIVGKFTGGVDFSDKTLQIGEHLVKDGDLEKIEPLMLNYGSFIQSIIDFTIIAFCIFIMVNLVNKARTSAEGPPAPKEAPATPEDIELLREIRDSLKK